jgi:PAS domain-containing protein
VTAGGLVLAVLLAFAGCSRSGALSGDVVVRNASGDVSRGARISVYLVLPSETFEREWAEAAAAFRQEVAPAAEAQQAAERRSEEARLAWDRALAARGKAGARRGRWTLALRESAAAGSQERWRTVRATEGLVFQARKRVWDIVRKHEEQAQALVEKHAAQRVQTDETGRYVLVKVPAGKAYVYARLREKREDFVWFAPVEIRAGTQQADLTQDNQRRWPFVP